MADIQWVDLPDLVLRVLSKLSSNKDLYAAALVCKEWREVVRENPRPDLKKAVVIDTRNQHQLKRGKALLHLAATADNLHSLALLPGKQEPHLVTELFAALAAPERLRILRRLCLDLNYFPSEQEEWWQQGLPNSLSQFSRLTVLHLHCDVSRHALGGIPACLLGMASHLRELALSGTENENHNNCGLKDDQPCECARPLPAQLCQLTRLTSLSLIHCGSKRIPSRFSRLTDLSVLRVIAPFGFCISMSSTLACALTCLEVLDIGSDRLSDIAMPPWLRHLTLRGLREFPDNDSEYDFTDDSSAGSAGSESEEAAETPKARAFQEALRPCFQLRTLCLRQCCLYHVPAAVVALTSLRRLAITHSHIRELPPGPYLEQLQHLDLRYNCFCKVPSTALEAPSLQTLAMRSFDEDFEGSKRACDLASAQELEELQRGVRGDWLRRQLVSESVQKADRVEKDKDSASEDGFSNKEIRDGIFLPDELMKLVALERTSDESRHAACPEEVDSFVAERFLPQFVAF